MRKQSALLNAIDPKIENYTAEEIQDFTQADSARAQLDLKASNDIRIASIKEVTLMPVCV